jgi:hypothetical protein
VETAYVGRIRPLTPEQMAASKAKLAAMDAKDKERIMLEESRNKLEAYIYYMKNVMADREEEVSEVSNNKQREEAMKLALAAQEWIDDEGYGADFETMEAKYGTLSVPFDKIMLRVKEKEALPKAVAALQKRLTEVEQLMDQWATERPQVTEEERKRVLEKIEEAKKWVANMEKKQAKKKPHEEPIFLSDEVPGQIKPIEVMVMRLSKKPKPKPPPKSKEENTTSTTTENSTDTTSAENATETTSGEAKKDATPEEMKDAPTPGQSKEGEAKEEPLAEGNKEEVLAKDKETPDEGSTTLEDEL